MPKPSTPRASSSASLSSSDLSPSGTMNSSPSRNATQSSSSRYRLMASRKANFCAELVRHIDGRRSRPGTGPLQNPQRRVGRKVVVDHEPGDADQPVEAQPFDQILAFVLDAGDDRKAWSLLPEPAAPPRHQEPSRKGANRMSAKSCARPSQSTPLMPHNGTDPQADRPRRPMAGVSHCVGAAG